MHALGNLALDALLVDMTLAEACHVVQEGLAVRNLIDDLVVQLQLVALGRGGGGGPVGAWAFGQDFLRRLAVELVAQRQLVLPVGAKAVDSATLKAASSSPRGSDRVELPRAARRTQRRRRRQTWAVPRGGA